MTPTNRVKQVPLDSDPSMRIVVKVGTRTLTRGSDRLSRPGMVDLVRQIAHLHAQGHELLFVSSGAVFAGSETLGKFPHRKDIPAKQTLAAVGQVRLMAIYEQLFQLYDVNIAQALLTRADLADRERYLNARNTMLSLLHLHIVPVINENDVVGVEEIRIGDNDNLSALVANLVDADLLIILTDQAGLFTTDPRLDPGARLIEEVATIDGDIRRMGSGGGSSIGTGGMATKIEAAEMATRSGTEVIIASGDEPDILPRLAAGEQMGTRFLPVASHIESRKRWILAEPPRGDLLMDQGAAEALIHRGKSLLAVGITDVLGSFERGWTVRLLAPDGCEIARGITLYGAEDLAAIRGHRSDEIAEILDAAYGPTVVHRDDMVLLTSRAGRRAESGSHGQGEGE
jgi:glutamate 5-kinase